MRYRHPARPLAALVAVLLVLAVWGATGLSSAAAADQPRNIIIMFADGAAPTQWDFGRYSSKVLASAAVRHDRRRVPRGHRRAAGDEPVRGLRHRLRGGGFGHVDGVKVKNGAVSDHAGRHVATHGHAGRQGRRQADRPGDDRHRLRRDAGRLRRQREIAPRLAGAGGSACWRWNPTCLWAAAPITSCRRALPAASGRMARTSSPRSAPAGTRSRETAAELTAAAGAQAARPVRGRRHGFRARSRSGPGADDRRDGGRRPEGAVAAKPERVRAAGREREHRHRRPRQRRRRADAGAVGVRRRGEGRARVPAPQPGHAGDRHRRPRDRRIFPDLRAEGSELVVQQQPVLCRRRAACGCWSASRCRST